MDQQCWQCGSDTPAVACVCRTDVRYCSWCFSLHARSGPAHRAAERAATLSPPRLCSLCRDRQGQWLCACQFPWRDYCGVCAQDHIAQAAEKHRLESSLARCFLLQQGDLGAYNRRQERTKEFERRIYDNLQILSQAKEVIDNTFSRLKSALDQWYRCARRQLEEISARVAKSMEEALTQLQARQYARFRRPGNLLDAFLLAPSDSPEEFAFLSVTDNSREVEECLAAGEFLWMRENYSLLQPTLETLLDTQVVQLQALRLT